MRRGPVYVKVNSEYGGSAQGRNCTAVPGKGPSGVRTPARGCARWWEGGRIPEPQPEKKDRFMQKTEAEDLRVTWCSGVLVAKSL